MPKRKPAGWPDLMIGKRLASGAVAYYWAPPTRAKRAGCPIEAEALGTDYGSAKRRCDEVLNVHYKVWLTKSDPIDPASRLGAGTLDWMVAVYKRSPKYKGKSAATRESYDRMLRIASAVRLKDGRTFGSLSLPSITPGAADKLFERLKASGPNGAERTRTAVLAMAVCKRAWNVARRAEPRAIPSDNPFAKMGLS